MTTLEERAPAGFFLTPTEREELTKLLARAEQAQAAMDQALSGLQRIVTATTDLDPHVDLGDPLAMFRLPSGLVGFQEEGARWVMRGDIVQAVHGDEGRWEEVVGIVHAQTQTGITTRRDDGTTRLRWWGHETPVRVAMAPADVVADQERKAGE